MSAATRTFRARPFAWTCCSATPKTQSDLACPHGVQFYDVAQDAARSKRAAWSYEAPRPSMSKVDHWIGFWEDVEVK